MTQADELRRATTSYPGYSAYLLTDLPTGHWRIEVRRDLDGAVLGEHCFGDAFVPTLHSRVTVLARLGWSGRHFGVGWEWSELGEASEHMLQPALTASTRVTRLVTRQRTELTTEVVA